MVRRGETAIAERVQEGLYAMSEAEMQRWEEVAEQAALKATEEYGVNRKRAEADTRGAGG